MRKDKELKDPGSCLNSALTDEMVFVLLGRDPAAPEAIRAWAQRRILLQKNTLDDHEIQSALATANLMERERDSIRHQLGKSL